MKTAAEYLDALEAQLTLLVKLTDEINRIIIVQINVTNENQNATIYELKEHVSALTLVVLCGKGRDGAGRKSLCVFVCVRVFVCVCVCVCVF